MDGHRLDRIHHHVIAGELDRDSALVETNESKNAGNSNNGRSEDHRQSAQGAQTQVLAMTPEDEDCKESEQEDRAPEDEGDPCMDSPPDHGDRHDSEEEEDGGLCGVAENRRIHAFQPTGPFFSSSPSLVSP